MRTPIESTPGAIDPVVQRYWEIERKALERDKDDAFAPGCSKEELDEMVQNRRGLLGSAHREYGRGFQYIAAGLIDEGLEHARWAVRFGLNFGGGSRLLALSEISKAGEKKDFITLDEK